MNIKKKISEVVLLTLAVVVGGGYVYYSLLTDNGDRFSKNPVVVFNNTPIVNTNSSIGSISTKGRRSNSPRPQNSITPGVSGTQLPSVAGRPASGSHATGMLSGSTGYSYDYRAKTQDKTNSSTGGSGVGGMLAFGSGGGRSSNNGLSAQSTGGVMLSEPGATTPFAAPKTPGTTPSNNGNGIYLVDPGTNTITGDEIGTQQMIPVGEGGWILLILALGYVGWKKK